MSKESHKKQEISSFTVDTDKTCATMPSITRLLNRKTLGLPSTSNTKKITPPPAPVVRPKEEAKPSTPPPMILENSIDDKTVPLTLELSHSPVESNTTAEHSNPSIQRAARRAGHRSSTSLIKWEMAQLECGSDPLGKGLSLLFKKSATSALFLAIGPALPNSPAPHFAATAAVGNAAKFPIWTGMKWDPTIVPDLWNYFIRTGYAELPPPGTETNIKSTRNVVRGAFGVEQNEWLMLLQVGTSQACRGIVAVLSTQSLQSHVSAALALMSTPLPKTKAA